MMQSTSRRLLGLLMWTASTVATAQGAQPVIDTTGAWTGIIISGYDAVGQTITAPPSGASLSAFEFFSVVPPPFNAYGGGVFEWDDVAGVVVGAPLASVSGSPPTVPGFPPVLTLAQARVRFDFPTPIPLQANRKYLLFANSSQPRFAAPSWLLTSGSYPFGLAKAIFPPNGTVTGPWTTVTDLAPGPDAWAIRVYFADPFAASPIPTVGPIAIGGLCIGICAIGWLVMHETRRRQLRPWAR